MSKKHSSWISFSAPLRLCVKIFKRKNLDFPCDDMMRLILILLLFLIFLVPGPACHKDLDGRPPLEDPSVPNDDDGPDEPGPVPNPDARTDAFRLFYRERAERTALSMNRFALAGDAAMGNTFLKVAIARDGNAWEVVPGPEGNNPFGHSTFATWKLYQAIGGRPLELTLIRMFEGLAFNQAVSGHPGLTTREALPGWTRSMDGIGGTVSRTRWGEAVALPVPYPPELEQEILEAFYEGVIFTYRENPEEFLFKFKPIDELGNFATTYVFAELDHEPPFLRVSDCCSSFMISQMGIWEGAYWGNHNSRDNFTDYALGFLAAFEAESTEGLPADLARAAGNAARAARRTGDSIVAHRNILMTVDEWHDYCTLTPAGNMNPDGEVEWQDLGSLASCQMAYAARAISSQGLGWPVPEVPLPGAIETSALRELFRELGLPPLPLPVMKCESLDDAFVGLGWGDMLAAEIFGVPLWEVAEVIALFFPDLFPGLLGGMMDDFSELELGAVVLCYYAQIVEEVELYAEARNTLSNLIGMQRILADLVYGLATDPRVIDVVGATAAEQQVRGAGEMLYKGAVYARLFGLDSPLADLDGFSTGDQHITYIESRLDMADTPYRPLLSDEEILDQVEARLAARLERSPWIIDRYRDRFGYTPPVRRAGDGYECVGPDDEWMPTENSRHECFQEFRLWFEAPLCVASPETLDCEWATLGCAPADLDDNGVVGADDQALFEGAWSAHGELAECGPENSWCHGADLDRSGILDGDDQGYMNAAQGCRI